MKALVALLVLSVASPVFAEGPTTVNLKAATLVPTEGPAINVVGGVWLSDDQALRIAQMIEPDNEKLDVHSETSPIVSVAIGIGIGLLGGFLLASL